MRWVIVGAGAVGGVIGGRLVERTDDEVVMVARGAHADAIEAAGLRVLGPHDRDVTVRPREVWRPGALGDLQGAVVLLAVKSHQTEGALRMLGPGIDRALAVVCAQNGVTNEPRVAEVFPGEVLGCMVWMPAVHLEPGVVESHGDPDGVLVLGSWSTPGPVRLGTAVAAHLAAAGFVAEQVDDVRAWKRGKLLTNLGNALDAFCTPGGRMDVFRRIQAEGFAVLDAAREPYVDPDTLTRHCSERIDYRAGPRPRPGGSTWQSLARGPGPIEIACLNGYIADLGRGVGVDAPLNRAIARIAGEFERGERAPRSLDAGELERLAAAG